MQEALQPLTLLHPLGQLMIAVLAILGLWFGSEKVIWGVKRLARKFGVSELLIGLTVVSIGSSLPEIFVNVSAGLRGADDIGVGNIVGSCFVQGSFILGLCVLLAGEMTTKHEKLKRDGTMVLGSIVLLWLFSFGGKINAFEALVLVLTYCGYIYYLLVSNRKNWKLKKSRSNMWLNFIAFAFGLGLVWISAEALLTVGIHAGHQAGLNDGVIGLLSGVGTTIPELSISLMALLRKSGGLSLGNLMGSNITDPLFSLGIGATLAQGYQVSNFLLFTAMPIWFLSAVLAMVFLWKGSHLTRLEGAILMAFYLGAFVVFLS